MTKTREELAKSHWLENCNSVCERDFLAGYDAGHQSRDEEVGNLLAQIHDNTCGYCDFDRSLSSEMAKLKKENEDLKAKANE